MENANVMRVEAMDMSTKIPRCITIAITIVMHSMTTGGRIIWRRLPFGMDALAGGGLISTFLSGACRIRRGDLVKCGNPSKGLPPASRSASATVISSLSVESSRNPSYQAMDTPSARIWSPAVIFRPAGPPDSSIFRLLKNRFPDGTSPNTSSSPSSIDTA